MRESQCGGSLHLSLSLCFSVFFFNTWKINIYKGTKECASMSPMSLQSCYLIFLFHWLLVLILLDSFAPPLSVLCLHLCSHHFRANHESCVVGFYGYSCYQHNWSTQGVRKTTVPSPSGSDLFDTFQQCHIQTLMRSQCLLSEPLMQFTVDLQAHLDGLLGMRSSVWSWNSSTGHWWWRQRSWRFPPAGRGTASEQNSMSSCFVLAKQTPHPWWTTAKAYLQLSISAH